MHQRPLERRPLAAEQSSRYCEAVSLGWQMSCLFRTATCQSTGKPKLPARLPTVHSASRSRRTEFAIAEVHATLGRLGLGGAAKEEDELSTTFQNNEKDNEDVKRCVYTLHMGIMREAFAKERAIGQAYELGRALADTCPEAIDSDEMARTLNRYRLDEIGRWLADLATRLPDHASRAVRISMTRWKIAAQQGASSTLFQAEELGQVHRALHRQVEIWRSLLTGQKLAKDTLGSGGYARAVGLAVSDTRRVLFGYLWRFLPFVIVVVALLGVGIWGVTNYEETAKVIASLGAIIGALGITWKGVGSTLGHIASEVEEPIWQGALDVVVADDITQQPARTVPLLVAAALAPAGGGTQTPDTPLLSARRAQHALPAASDTDAPKQEEEQFLPDEKG